MIKALLIRIGERQKAWREHQLLERSRNDLAIARSKGVVKICRFKEEAAMKVNP